MKKLVVPAYGWRTAKALFKYAETTKAKDPWSRRQETGVSACPPETTLPVVAKPDAEHRQGQQQAGDQ